MADNPLKLVIGNRNYSSWSLRAWLFVAASGIEAQTERVSLFTGEWKQRLAEFNAAGRVPILVDGDLIVWDTIAIVAHLQERFPDKALPWPRDARARALARSIVGEMHSGFLALRDELPQNLRERTTVPYESLSAECRSQIARVESIWEQCRFGYGQGGEFLFGEFGVADAFFAPVALRFLTYGIPLRETSARYRDAIASHPLVQQFVTEGQREEERLPFIDSRTPAQQGPLVLG